VPYQGILEAVHTTVSPLVGCGRVADYIPALTTVDPHRFGLALATTDGPVYGVGDSRTPFSLQSVSKVFTLALVLSGAGDAIWERVRREPSGHPFNALQQVEHDRGVPPNPFVNAGALIVVDHLLTLTRDPTGAVLNLLRAEAGNPAIDVDEQMVKSEAEHRHRNAALAHLLADYGRLTHPVDAVLDQYTALCAIAMSCEDLARAGGFLARHGLRADGSRLLSRSDAKRLNATMSRCPCRPSVTIRSSRNPPAWRTSRPSTATLPTTPRSRPACVAPTTCCTSVRSCPHTPTITPTWRTRSTSVAPATSSTPSGPSRTRRPPPWAGFGQVRPGHAAAPLAGYRPAAPLRTSLTRLSGCRAGLTGWAARTPAPGWCRCRQPTVTARRTAAAW